VSCPEWMTQWGSKYLGDQGYTPIEILRYYYGESMYINTAEQSSGIPSSWPGYDLTIGSSGDKIRQLQEQFEYSRKCSDCLRQELWIILPGGSQSHYRTE
jgi:hypothetical protein